MFPKTARHGAMDSSVSVTSSEPMSPACQISSDLRDDVTILNLNGHGCQKSKKCSRWKGHWSICYANSPKKLEYCCMKSIPFSLIVLFLLCCAQVPEGWSQSEPPSRRARKAFEDAKTAYRYREISSALELIHRAIERSPNYADPWF